MRVDLDPKQRAGLFTQMGFLATNATEQAPAVIIRGVHVSLDALCVELPAPPNVPPESPDATSARPTGRCWRPSPRPGSVCEGCHAR